MERHLKRGFTMIELLVVVAIIGILAAVLAPVASRLFSKGDDLVARNNLHLLGQAALSYLADHGGYPSAGGYFSQFTLIKNGSEITYYGRSRGWVYFEHECPRASGDETAADDIGDGQGDTYSMGEYTSSDVCTGSFVNEAGVCKCFDATSNEGGMSWSPAAWFGTASAVWSAPQVALINGALYDYLGGNLDVFTNPAFEKKAAEKLGVSRNQMCRAYAMNVITGADEDLYDTGRDLYVFDNTDKKETDRGHSSINTVKVGPRTLKAYESASNETDKFKEVLSLSETALFVELDPTDTSMSEANSLAGDQVWDWDGGDENMGFNHEDSGIPVAYVCFADGSVGAIRDPSSDPENPDTSKRLKVSKYYGSGGINASGEKLD